MIAPIRAAADSRGSSLVVAIVLMTLMLAIGAAIVEVSRFGHLAARAQVSAAAAMHLADMGLNAYETGALPALGTSRLESRSGAVTISAEQILRLTDSTVVVLVRSRGVSPDGPRPTGRRALLVIMWIDTAAVRRRISGSLAEEV